MSAAVKFSRDVMGDEPADVAVSEDLLHAPDVGPLPRS
jgi:hypothetical protein